MVNQGEQKVEIFSEDVKCDRYHILKPTDNIDSDDIIYDETGKAFNGFDNEIILNTDYDSICNSRFVAITRYGVHSSNRVFYLINNFREIRNDKTSILVERDAWMSNRGNITLGKDNTVFETDYYMPDYPYYEFAGKYKYFYNMEQLERLNGFVAIIVYHHSSLSQNTNSVYLIHGVADVTVYSFLIKVFRILAQSDFDSNNIISISITPLNINYYITMGMLDFTDDFSRGLSCSVYGETLEKFNNLCMQYPTYKEVNIVCNPYEKSVITDMNGAIVWQAEQMNVGTKYLKYILNASLSLVYWDCVIQDINDSSSVDNIYIEKAPNKRFSIICNGLPFFADYYQQYMNTERSFNIQKRQAQLDKQLLDGIGDTIASTLWHGTSSGAPKKDAEGLAKYFPATSMIATAGAAVGGAIQTGINWYSTDDYFKKLNDIENRQAKVQYDKLIASSDSIAGFAIGRSYPSLGLLRVDDETYKSHVTFNPSRVLVKYNCRVDKDILQKIMNYDSSITLYPNYLSGDFDFQKMNVIDALQLNTRFKNGVEFVDWK